MAATTTSAPAPKTNVIVKIWNWLSAAFWTLLGRVETSALLKRLESEPFVAPAHSKAWYLCRALIVLGVLVLTHGVAYHVGHGTPKVMRIVALASPYVNIGESDVVPVKVKQAWQARALDCEANKTPPVPEQVTFPPNADPATFEAEHPAPKPASADLAPLKLPAAKLPKLPKLPQKVEKKAAAEPSSVATAMMADTPPVVKKKPKPKCEGWCAVSNAFKAN